MRAIEFVAPAPTRTHGLEIMRTASEWIAWVLTTLILVGEVWYTFLNTGATWVL